MPWLFLCVYSLFAASLYQVVGSVVLPPIHWNASNPMFKSSNNDHVIKVHLGDEADVICPHYPYGHTNTNDEYYIIYQVSKSEYESCNINTNIMNILIVNCSVPRSSRAKRFTILFDKYAAIPNTPEYKPGHTYYYISTSTGSLDGISSASQGACAKRNLKMIIKVCCESTTGPTLPSTSTHLTKTTSSPRRTTTPRTSRRTTSSATTKKVHTKTQKPIKPGKENEVNPHHKPVISGASPLRDSHTLYLAISSILILLWTIFLR